MTTTPIPDPVAAIALLDEPTRRRLYELVLTADAPIGRDDAATTLGISRELAAFHLDRLAAGGLLATEFGRRGTRRGPGAGRPAKLYRPSDGELAVSFPARDYQGAAEVFADALAGLDEPAGVDAVAAVARARGAATGTRARRLAGPRPGIAALSRALVELLREAGYEPDADPAVRSIRLRNCPYSALAARHRELTCGMNLAWAEGVVDGLGGARFEAELTPQAGTCCVRFERTPAGRARTDTP